MGAWTSTLRLRTLPAAATPVIMGTAIAYHLGGFALAPALAALAGALLLQIGTNLANDYYDHVKGADTPDRTGPVRASASGLLAPHLVRNAAFATFGLAALVGTYLISVGGWPILVIGAAGILSGIFYTAGPKALAYVGLGDLFAFVFFGPVAVAGTVYVQTGTWEATAIAWGVGAGFLTSAILAVNNLRDIPTDAAAGKRTLAVRMGQRMTRWFYASQIAAALAVPFIVGHFADEPWFLLPVGAGPLAIPLLLRVFHDWPNRAQYNPALGGTARLLLAYGLLTAIALLVA